MYQIILDKGAKKHIEKLNNNKKLLAKVVAIIDKLAIDPYSPAHKFERLKGNLSGYCSKRLDQKNRIIYQVIDQKIIVIVVSVLGHYDA
jgi:Txe/YoeB family toxin of toxin-antitoxin system